MTRVVAGRWRGRRLEVPRSGTRPTADRVREAVFSSLDHDLGGFDRLAVLDLYAGSGALGIEALSRGAARAVFVESDPASAAVIRRNLAALGAADEATVMGVSVVVAARRAPPGGGFGLVLADPPYDLPAAALRAALTALAEGGWLEADATVLVERSRRAAETPWPVGFAAEAERDYGETRVWYGRRNDRPPGTAS